MQWRSGVDRIRWFLNTGGERGLMVQAGSGGASSMPAGLLHIPADDSNADTALVVTSTCIFTVHSDDIADISCLNAALRGIP